MKELARLGTKAIDQPVVILHPMLLVTQQPVVNRHQPGGEMMRFLDRANHAHGVRFTLYETLNAGHDRRGRRAVTTAGVGRDDEDFWSLARRHLFFVGDGISSCLQILLTVKSIKCIGSSKSDSLSVRVGFGLGNCSP